MRNIGPFSLHEQISVPIIASTNARVFWILVRISLSTFRKLVYTFVFRSFFILFSTHEAELIRGGCIFFSANLVTSIRLFLIHFISFFRIGFLFRKCPSNLIRALLRVPL